MATGLVFLRGKLEPGVPQGLPPTTDHWLIMSATKAGLLPLSSGPERQNKEHCFQGLQLEREACLASNYALAKENLALRPRLEMGRAALAIKYQELREVAESCADKLQRLEESMHRWSPHCALGWLQAELEEAEQEAEEQMEQLLLGEQSLEAFLPAFQRGRALAHLRRTQAEKLQELLRRRERSGPAPLLSPRPSQPEPPHR
ncbi:vacuolar protein sorting-associated protein 37D-like protein [Camelus ferus]|nr:vacuolar protein sorting-associated protein 37D-like protein [Camelus ferus]